MKNNSFLKPRGLRRKVFIFIITISFLFFDLSPTLNNLHPLRVKTYDSNFRLVVDEDGNGKFKLGRNKITLAQHTP